MLVWPQVSRGAVKDTKHVNAQTRVCTCQLRLQFLPGFKMLLEIFQATCIDRDLTPRLLGSNLYQRPGLRRSASPTTSPFIRVARLRRPGSA